MDISSKLRKTIRYTSIILHAFGVDFTARNYRISARNIYPTFTSTCYIAFTIYTILKANPYMMWQCLALVGLGAQGVLKYITAILHAHDAFEIIEDWYQLYHDVQREGQSSVKYKMLDKSVDFSLLVLKIYWSLFMAVFLLLIAYPPLFYVITGEKVLMITLFIPGIDPFSYWGFIIHYVAHAVSTLICFAGTPIGDFYFMLDVVHIYIFAEFLNVKIGEFNEFLIAHHDGMSDSNIRRTLKTLVNELIVEQLHYADYVESLSDIYRLMITLHMGSATFSLAISLFVLYTTSWFVSFIVVSISLFQLLVYSVLGSVVEKKNDDVVNYISNLLWYLMPVSEQKILIPLIVKTQRAAIFEIGFVGLPLNVDTCVEILKTIYTYFMMLVNTS